MNRLSQSQNTYCAIFQKILSVSYSYYYLLESKRLLILHPTGEPVFCSESKLTSYAVVNSGTGTKLLCMSIAFVSSERCI